MPPKLHIDLLLAPAVLLAAGASTRLGQPKQLLQLPTFGGETLLDHAVGLAQAAGAMPLFVVLGAHAEEIQRQSQLSHCTVLRNEAWAEGMASSIRIGIAAVIEQAPNASGAILLVCDQPALSVEHLRQLLATHRKEPDNIAASHYAGRPGVPAVFPRALFPALMELQGDQGARAILQRSGRIVHQLEFPRGEWDIDSPGDMETLQSNAQTPSHRPHGQPRRQTR